MKIALCTITKGTYGMGTSSRADDSIVWAKAGECAEVSAEMFRVAGKIKAGERDLFRMEPTGKGEIVRVGEGRPFGAPLESVATYDLDPRKDIAFHRRALSRLGWCLQNRRQDGYEYFGRIIAKEVGTVIFNTESRTVTHLDRDAREKKVAAIRRGRRAAVTRTRNKMEKIKDKYAKTLMPDEYADDRKYHQLARYLPDQIARAEEADAMGPSDIPPLSVSLLSPREIAAIEEYLSGLGIDISF
jgi:hypothetical protein